MPIRVHCPSCQALFNLDDQLAGQTVRCSRCGQVFRLPPPVKQEPVPITVVESGKINPHPLPASELRTSPQSHTGPAAALQSARENPRASQVAKANQPSDARAAEDSDSVKWEFVSKHRFTWRGFFTWTWMWPLMGLPFVFIGVATLIFAPTRTAEDASNKLGWCAFGFGVTGVTLVPMVWRFCIRVSSVRLYKEGLEWRRGGREWRYSWQEVREVYRTEEHFLQGGAQPSDWNRTSRLRLIFTDGKEVSFNHILSKYDRLAGYIQQVTAQQLLPAATAALLKEGVAFGRVHLSCEGIQFKDDYYTWDEVAARRGRKSKALGCGGSRTICCCCTFSLS